MKSNSVFGSVFFACSFFKDTNECGVCFLIRCLFVLSCPFPGRVRYTEDE